MEPSRFSISWRSSRASLFIELTARGLDLEKKIFSASGRGGAFFLTSPLSRNLRRRLDQAVRAPSSVNWKPSWAAFLRKNWSCWFRYLRSEERRVGKEG